jgi:cytidylate kinase
MIVTLSRQMGALGEVIAARVAAAFDLRLIDRVAVYNAAIEAGMPENVLRELVYEGQRSLTDEILESLGRGSTKPSSQLSGLIAPMLPPVSLTSDEAVGTLGLLIKDLASGGHTLVLGQAGQVWLRGYQGACHVQIMAPFELRAARIAEQQRISLTEARRVVRASDRGRADSLMRHHGLHWLDPLLYHMVINTGQVPVETAIVLIGNAGQALAMRN